MKTLKIILVIIILLALVFVGYQGYLAYQKWQNDQKNTEQKIVDLLVKNSELIVKLEDRISKTEVKLVSETLKKVTIVKPDETYTALKDTIIELKKDKEKNKKELKALKDKQSENREEFLSSDYTLYIRLEDDTKLIFHRNPEGTLVADTGKVIKIIEHKSLSETPPILVGEELAISKTSWDFKFGGFYALDKSYGIIISKGIFTVKDYSINASLLVSDFEDFKFAVGGDVGYLVGDNLELGIGYSTDKEYYIKLQYSF